MNTEQEIIDLKKRNVLVEQEKAWEVSWARKCCIVVLTYSVITLFFYFMKLPSPAINAIVPTLGFILSTLSLSFLKNLWIKYFYKNKNLID